MKTFIAATGTLAGLLSASSLFAQAPGEQYQLTAYRPGATYYAEPSAPAQLWSNPATNVSYNPAPQAALEPIPSDQAYLDALEGRSSGSCESASSGSMSSEYGSAMGGSCESDYGTYGVGGDYFCGNPCSPWFVYGGALIMNRNSDNEAWLSYDSGDYSARTMGSSAAAMDWTGGYQVTLGRRFDGSSCAWAVNFWAIRDDAEASVTNAGLVGNLNSTLDSDFQGLSYNNGIALQNATAYFNNAMVHQLQRSYDFYNVELNLFQDPTLYSYCNSCSNFSVGGLAGLRYFKFSEGMTYSSDTADGVFNGDMDEIHYGIDCDNDLVGVQLGFLGNYNRGPLNLYVGSKFGIYGNHISSTSQVYGANGYAVIDNALSPNDGREFNISGSKNNVSFVGELDLGGSYCFGQHFKVTAGYRALLVSDVALTTNQIPQNFEDLDIVATPQSNGDVVLHGAYLGGTFTW